MPLQVKTRNITTVNGLGRRFTFGTQSAFKNQHTSWFFKNSPNVLQHSFRYCKWSLIKV